MCSTLAFSIGIQHWHSTLTLNIDIQHRHSTLAFNIGIPGHGGQDGLLAEGYVAKISMLILATYPVAALDGTVRNQNQN